MRLPVRKSQLLRDHDDGPVLMTPGGVEKMKRDIERMKRERPGVVEELSIALAKGDLSENAEYRDARDRLNRIDSRTFSITDRLKRIRVIEPGTTSSVQLGSNVTVEVDNESKTYEIVGPSETNPSRGRISHLSPLGSAMIGKIIGETVEVNGRTYRILAIT